MWHFQHQTCIGKRCHSEGVEITPEILLIMILPNDPSVYTCTKSFFFFFWKLIDCFKPYFSDDVSILLLHGFIWLVSILEVLGSFCQKIGSWKYQPFLCSSPNSFLISVSNCMTDDLFCLVLVFQFSKGVFVTHTFLIGIIQLLSVFL